MYYISVFAALSVFHDRETWSGSASGLTKKSHLETILHAINANKGMLDVETRLDHEIVRQMRADTKIPRPAAPAASVPAGPAPSEPAALIVVSDAAASQPAVMPRPATSELEPAAPLARVAVKPPQTSPSLPPFQPPPPSPLSPLSPQSPQPRPQPSLPAPSPQAQHPRSPALQSQDQALAAPAAPIQEQESGMALLDDTLVTNDGPALPDTIADEVPALPRAGPPLAPTLTPTLQQEEETLQLMMMHPMQESDAVPASLSPSAPESELQDTLPANSAGSVSAGPGAAFGQHDLTQCKADMAAVQSCILTARVHEAASAAAAVPAPASASATASASASSASAFASLSPHRSWQRPRHYGRPLAC